jgi:aspartate/glutamate racemase
MTRVALIHALAHSVGPINEELARVWPDCQRMNLLDDSLSADLARSAQGLDEAMHHRFEVLAAYAESTGAKAILFTCSAFGPCIDAVASRRPGMPVLKPNEAMVADAATSGRRVGLIASFAPTLVSMPSEFPAGVDVILEMAEGAMDALNNGDVQLHDQIIAASALRLVKQGCDVIALAQFSMARAHFAVRCVVQVPVLTTPGSAVAVLCRRFKR